MSNKTGREEFFGTKKTPRPISTVAMAFLLFIILATPDAARGGEAVLDVDISNVVSRKIRVSANPFGTSPLTAVLTFETLSEAQVDIAILGECPVFGNDRAFRKKHVHPVVGLYPGRNRLLLTVRDRQDQYEFEKDRFHMNSIWYDPRDDSLLIAGKHQGIVKVTAENEPVWILSPHKGWGKAGKNGEGGETSDYLLTAVDKSDKPYTRDIQLGVSVAEDFDWPWGQHTPLVLP